MALISDVSFLLQGFDTSLETLFEIVCHPQEYISHCAEETGGVSVTIKCSFLYVCIIGLIQENKSVSSTNMLVLAHGQSSQSNIFLLMNKLNH
jgi:hypothetical protein